LKPDYTMAYNNRGNCYSKLGQPQLSIEDYNKAISLKPNYADAYGNRGTAYIMQGNKELGCRDARKACELGICKLLEAANTRGLCR
ncbi:MAG: tetratricopeptide repeat protein, partial [Smithella sp.]